MNLIRVLATKAVMLYASDRATGLADLGRRVDLVVRSIRRGDTDLEPAEAFRRNAKDGQE